MATVSSPFIYVHLDKTMPQMFVVEKIWENKIIIIIKNCKTGIQVAPTLLSSYSHKIL